MALTTKKITGLHASRLPGALITCLFLALPVAAKPLVAEIADPTLPDIAAVQHQPGRAPIILYNPLLCRQAGPALCEFYRYHEYGHLILRHHDRPGMSAQQKEWEADRWAAQHAPAHAILAAWHFFSSGGGASPVHGDGPTRAARLTAG